MPLMTWNHATDWDLGIDGGLPRVPAEPRFDDAGFLVEPSEWTPDLARWIAARDGLPTLTDAHLRVIDYLREHYLKLGSLPVMSHVCRANRLPEDCVTTLFRGAREAWRVAGLPNPGSEAVSYMQ